MKIFKKISMTAVLLALIAVLLTALGISVSAETYGELTYTVSEDEVTITDCDDAVTEIVIPTEIDGFSVTAIAEDAFDGCTALVDVYYGGNEETWDAIGFEFGEGVKFHYNFTDFESHYTAGETTPPTCTEKGYTTYTCDCEYSYTVDGEEALGHDYVGTVTTAATCKDTGVMIHECRVCEDTYSETIPVDKNNHTGETEIRDTKDATCVAEGYTGNTYCVACDTEIADDGESIPALGHDIITDAAVPATCTTTGLTEGSHCSRCNDATVEPEVTDALGHNNIVISASEPTCTTEGLSESTYCTRCKELTAEPEVIPALGHTEATREENRTEASCSEDGSYDLVTYCSACNEVLRTEEKTIPATGEHVYATETERTASTCKTAGYVVMACGCGETKTTELELDATNHETVVVIDAVAPTCTEKGSTEGRHCTACDTVIAMQEETAALGHTWTDATCTAPKTCTVCQATEGETADHTWKDATCTAPKTCTVCKTTDGNPKGHKFTNYISNNDATCTEDGTKSAKCDNCNAKTTIADADTALGHSWTDATCTDPRTCAVCKETEGEALGHDWVEVADSRTCNTCGLTEWGSLQLIITADKTTAEPADTITYTVALTPVKNISGIEFQLVIPEGLTFVSGELADGLQETLGAAACNFNKEAVKVVIGGGMNYTSTELTTILTFTCTVNKGFTGELMISVSADNWYFENSDFEEIEVVLNNADAKVAVSCTHKSYVEKTDSKYLKDEADCYSAAVYFKSCAFCYEASETETFEYGEALGHDWADPTCNASSTCKVCNATTGIPLGHNFVNYVSDNNATCTVDGTKTAKCERCDTTNTLPDEGTASHKWAAANCLTPETCTVCKETRGEASGHTWTDATCTTAKTCTVCNTTDGEVPGHDWQEATDVLPKMCNRCGTTDDVTVQLIITADKDTAKIGDTITYTVSLGPVYKIAGIEFMLDIPEGLTFRGYELIPGIQQTLNAAACNFNADKLKLVIGGGMAYTNAEITPILTFTCTVNNGFVGDLVINLDADSLYIEDIYNEADIEIVNEGSKVNIPCAHSKTTVHEAVASSCTTPGHAEYSTCNLCGVIVDGSNEPLELDPENHVNVTTHAAVAGTCLLPGHAEYKECDDCGIIVSGSTDEVINPHGNSRLADEKYLKTPASCTTVAVYYMYCEHCGEANITATFTSGTALGHDIITLPGVAPTCTESGLTEGSRCSRCDDVTTQSVIPATGHSWNAAACTEAKTCTVCNITEGAALGHTWADATCTEPKTCTVCNATEGEALGHTWTDATCTTAKTCTVCSATDGTALGHDMITVPGYAATCTETGLTDGSYCSRCDDAKTEQTVIPATGHTEITVPGKAATCTETGLTDGSKCSVCDTVFIAQEVIPATGHTETAVPGFAATCSATGLTDGSKCSVCGAVIKAQDVIPTIAHTIIAITGKAATCTETGLTDGSKCSVCDTIINAQEVIPTTDHTIVAITGKAATCTETGLTDGSYCSVCNTVINTQEIIPATGHNEVSVPGKVATCTETGLTDGSKCSDCDTVIKVQEIISATGHSEITVPGKAATCTETGLTDGSKCSVCDTVIKAQEIIPATGHNEITVPGKAATCTDAGFSNGAFCSVCDTVIKAQEIIPATGHTEVTVEGNTATCTETGLTNGSKCSVCDTVIKAQEIIPATGHTEAAVTGKAATCTEAGLTDGSKCSVCDTVIKAQEVIPAKGHAFGDWTVTKAPTIADDGVEERVCSVCGEKETRTIEKLDHLPGDVNSDGQITAADARIILRVSAKLDNAANYNVPLKIFDITRDDNITAADARKVLRIAAKLEK